MKGELVISNIENCARCGGTHKQLKFELLQRPIVDDAGVAYSYWALCPVTKQPVLCRKFTPSETLSETDGKQT